MSGEKKRVENSSEVPKERDEIEELKIFIKRRKIQNDALKKIITKLDADDNQSSKK